MDWASFFKDNSQSIFTLGGVFLGSLITFLISYLNNRFLAKESEKERQEQRKEAKTQLALELMRNDIMIIEDRIDSQLRAVDTIHTLSLRKSRGELSQDEMKKQLFSMYLDENGKLVQEGEREMIADKVASAIGEHFYSEFRKFNDLCLEFWRMSLNSPFSHEKALKGRLELSAQAAKLHNMLNEKLISLRE